MTWFCNAKGNQLANYLTSKTLPIITQISSKPNTLGYFEHPLSFSCCDHTVNNRILDKISSTNCSGNNGWKHFVICTSIFWPFKWPHFSPSSTIYYSCSFHAWGPGSERDPVLLASCWYSVLSNIFIDNLDEALKHILSVSLQMTPHCEEVPEGKIALQRDLNRPNHCYEVQQDQVTKCQRSSLWPQQPQATL